MRWRFWTATASPCPPAVRAALEAGLLETPKPGDAVFAGHAVHLIATPQQSLEAAAQAARAAGWAAHILSDESKVNRAKWARCTRPWRGLVAQRGAPLQRPCVLLSGGETTVTVRPRLKAPQRPRWPRG